MASSFIEQATLMVKDAGATATINKINQALLKLQATAKALKSTTVSLNIKDAGLTKTIADVTRLTTAVRSLQNQRINIAANVNTQGAQAQLNRLRSQARAPVAMNGAGAGGLGLGTIIGGTAIGHLISSAIRTGLHEAWTETKEGVKQSDVGAMIMKYKRRTPEQQIEDTAAIKAIQEDQRQAGGGAVFVNVAETQKLYAELMAMIGGEATEAKHIIGQAISAAKVGVTTGQTPEEAKTGMWDIIKVGEQMGELTDPTTGKYSEAMAEKYFNAIRQMQEFIPGFTGQKFRTMMSAAGGAKYGMEPAAMQVMGLLEQEMGQRAGTAVNQALKNLTGNVLTKVKKRRLIQLGLLSPESLKETGDLLTYFQPGGGAKDEEALRTNMLDWTEKKLVPAMQKLHLDPTKSTDINRFVSGITSGKGTDAIDNFIKNMLLLHRDLTAMRALPGSKEEADTISRQSTTLAMESVTSEIQSALGETAQAWLTNPKVMEGVHWASNQLSQMAENMKAGGPIDPSTFAASAGGAAVLGLSTALTALTSRSPAISALGGAALALDGSAGLLSGAAVGLAAIPSIIASGLGVPLLGPFAGSSGPGSPGYRRTEPTAEEYQRELNLAHAYSDLYVATNKLSDLNKSAAAAPGAKTAVQEEISKLTAEIFQLGASADDIAALNERMKRLGLQPLAPVAPIPVETSKPASPSMTEPGAANMPLIKAIEGLKPTFKVPLPLARPPGAPTAAPGVHIITEPKPEAAPISSVLKSLSTYVQSQITVPPPTEKPFGATAAIPFTEGADKLTAASGVFESVFSTGASAISGAGQSAIDAMIGGAGSVGSIIGDAALARIQSAQVNVNVNATVNTPKADTGLHSTAGGD